ncbi:hypothetical protein NE237_005378 [Protea cynaroides]|uniref:Uncharacterized protein n=1 Tax=Protea cynaroides TaxID=273540 RepID=A0A9Q0KL81_9MAGN|nr:hypothetical protein NE237_005378 [Protea cynaroides]
MFKSAKQKNEEDVRSRLEDISDDNQKNTSTFTFRFLARLTNGKGKGEGVTCMKESSGEAYYTAQTPFNIEKAFPIPNPQIANTSKMTKVTPQQHTILLEFIMSNPDVASALLNLIPKISRCFYSQTPLETNNSQFQISNFKSVPGGFQYKWL